MALTVLGLPPRNAVSSPPALKSWRLAAWALGKPAQGWCATQARASPGLEGQSIFSDPCFYRVARGSPSHWDNIDSSKSAWGRQLSAESKHVFISSAMSGSHGICMSWGWGRRQGKGKGTQRVRKPDCRQATDGTLYFKDLLQCYALELRADPISD